jgi:hypothetical protein
MTSADLERLHTELLDFGHIDFISDQMREVIEDLWPELPTSSDTNTDLWSMRSAILRGLPPLL